MVGGFDDFLRDSFWDVEETSIFQKSFRPHYQRPPTETDHSVEACCAAGGGFPKPI